MPAAVITPPPTMAVRGSRRRATVAETPIAIADNDRTAPTTNALSVPMRSLAICEPRDNNRAPMANPAVIARLETATVIPSPRATRMPLGTETGETAVTALAAIDELPIPKARILMSPKTAEMLTAYVPTSPPWVTTSR